MNHLPVLLEEVIQAFDYLSSKRDGYFVDATLGAAGHSLALKLKVNGKKHAQNSVEELKVIGIDKDQSAVDLAKHNIDSAGLSDQFIFIHDDFKNVKKILQDYDIEKINGGLIDLGVSSMQLDQSERGFTFQDPNAPLDMRMDQAQELDAFGVINKFPQSKIEKILRELGEEKFAGHIARNICKARKEKPIEKTGELLAIIKRSIPPKIRYGQDKHFATNVFRALRIYINGELEKLDQAITDFVDCLESKSRLAVITFHSGEDRIVKDTFRRLQNPCTCPPDLPACVCGRKPQVKIIAKKPIVPTETEIKENPRARSAKMRIVERI